MGSIFFLKWPLLFGMLAAGLPVLIHLIHKQKRRRLRFSTLRFLVVSDKRSARRHKLVDLLVLILRTALLLLLPLGLAQPMLRPPGAASTSFGKMALGIVLDDSMSMRRSDEGVALFDKAVEATRRILEEIPQDGEAFVLLSSGRAPAQLATPTRPPATLAGLLDGLECSYGGRSFSKAVRDATDSLRGSKLENHALVVVTDLGASAFVDAGSVNRERLAEEVASIHVVDVGSSDRPNLALGRVAGFPTTAFPGAPLSILADVANAGSDLQQTLVSLWVGEEKIVEKEIAVAPGRPATVAFEHVLHVPGLARVSVRLQPDGLAADNHRRLVFKILDSVNAAIATPPGVGGSLGDEALFLRTALNPLMAPTTSGTSPVTVFSRNYLGFRPEDLGSYDAVFLIHDPSIPPGLVSGFEQYVEGGGMVVVFPAADLTSDPTALPQLQARGYAGFPVGDLWTAGEGESPMGIGEAVEEHPIVSLLLRSAPQLFGAVTSQRFLALDENRFDASTRVVVRMADGAPFLVEKRVGRGTWIAFTTGCHPSWSDLPLRPLFLPLLYETLKYGQGESRSTPRTAMVDDGFSVELPERPEGGVAIVVDAQGMEARIEMSSGQSRLTYTDTATPGFYSAGWLGEDFTPELLAINSSHTESDSERISREDLALYFPESRAVSAEREVDTVIQSLSYSSKGVALAAPFLWMALLVLLVEAYLANALLRGVSDQPGWLRRLKGKF